MSKKYVCTIVRNKEMGVDEVVKISFYPSAVPKTEEEIWKIAQFEFPLLDRSSVEIQKSPCGGVDIVPRCPQPRPEREFPPMTIFHCDRPKSFAKLIALVREVFPEVPFENLEPEFGIVSFGLKIK